MAYHKVTGLRERRGGGRKQWTRKSGDTLTHKENVKHGPFRDENMHEWGCLKAKQCIKVLVC